MASRACRELAGVVLALADDLGDLGVAVVEHVVQQEHRALLRREALQEHEEGERERVGHLGLAGRIGRAVGHERLGQPLADVGLASHAGRAQLVDREPRGHRRDVRPRRLDPLALLERLVEAEERLLDHVLGLGDAAEHPVGDRERRRAQLLEQLVVRVGHAASPREALPPARVPRLPAELALGLRVRRAAHLGHHDRRGLAGEQPAEPARHVARRLARRRREPASGSHSATGAGSSSTML